MTQKFNLRTNFFSFDFWEVILIQTLPEKVDEKIIHI